MTWNKWIENTPVPEQIWGEEFWSIYARSKMCPFQNMIVSQSNLWKDEMKE